MLLRLSLYASRFCEVGGGGRANGLGGPVAPADSTALALGDGGGRTMWSVFRAGLADAPPDGCAESPTADSPSEASEGICKFNLGRAPDLDPDVLDRCGGGNSLVLLPGRAGWAMGCDILG
jgi:hypothetical protein